MTYMLPTDKQIHVAVSYAHAKGNPAEVDGDVTWASSDDTVATVTPESGTSMTSTAIYDSGLTEPFLYADETSGSTIDVREFGATPDNISNDDSNAISAAINAAAPGDEVY